MTHVHFCIIYQTLQMAAWLLPARHAMGRTDGRRRRRRRRRQALPEPLGVAAAQRARAALEALPGVVARQVRRVAAPAALVI